MVQLNSLARIFGVNLILVCLLTACPDPPPPSPPGIHTLKPSSGLISGGTRVVLTGGSFQQGAEVYFGSDKALNITVATDGQSIECDTPPVNNKGLVDVRVKNPDGGSAVIANAFNYILQPPPPNYSARIDRIAPNRGDRTQDTPITVFGAHFKQGASVRIGWNDCLNPVINAQGTEIRCTVPQRAFAGVYNIVVTNPGQSAVTLVNAFTYDNPPPPPPALATITGVLPANGVRTVVTPIRIQGTNFKPGVMVRLGNFLCLNVIVNAARTEISCDVPVVPVAGYVDLTIQNPGQVAAVRLDAFRFHEPPPPPAALAAILNIVPNSGDRTVVTPIQINGNNFQVGVAVTIGGFLCQNVQVQAGGTQIRCNVQPRAYPGVSNVEIRNPGQAPVVRQFAYTFNNPLPPVPLPPAPPPAVLPPLVAGTNAQERIWVGLENGLDMSAQVAALRGSLLGIPVRQIPQALGGAGQGKKLLEFNGVNPVQGPIRGLFKPNMHGGQLADGRFEVAAYRLDQLLGFNIVPLTVERNNLDGEEGSVQFFFEGLPRADLSLFDFGLHQGVPQHLPQSSNFATVLLFDYLIGDADRFNGGNMLLWNWRNHIPSQKSIAIDHGETFKNGHGGYIDPFTRHLMVRANGLMSIEALTATVGVADVAIYRANHQYRFLDDQDVIIDTHRPSGRGHVLPVADIPVVLRQRIRTVTKQEVDTCLVPLVGQAQSAKVFERIQLLRRVANW